MNLSDLTEEQQQTVLFHFRAAVLARATQWDHELEIEKLLDREVELEIEDYAAGVNDRAEGMEANDLTFIGMEDLQALIPDEDYDSRYV